MKVMLLLPKPIMNLLQSFFRAHGNRWTRMRMRLLHPIRNQPCRLRRRTIASCVSFLWTVNLVHRLSQLTARCVVINATPAWKTTGSGGLRLSLRSTITAFHAAISLLTCVSRKNMCMLLSRNEAVYERARGSCVIQDHNTSPPWFCLLCDVEFDNMNCGRGTHALSHP